MEGLPPPFSIPVRCYHEHHLRPGVIASPGSLRGTPLIPFRHQVADAPLARQPADAKPAALAGEGRSSAASGKPTLWRRRTAPAPSKRRFGLLRLTETRCL